MKIHSSELYKNMHVGFLYDLICDLFSLFTVILSTNLLTDNILGKYN